MCLLLSAAVILVLTYIISYYRWVAKYPRGPTPLPLVGNLLFLKSETLHLQYHRLSLQYGPVFTVFVPVPIVIFCGYDAIREAFVEQGDEFSDRPQTSFHQHLSFCENGGIIMSNGENWKENRAQAHSILRQFGMNTNVMEEKARVKHSIEEYIRFLDQIADKRSVDMRWPIQLMVANVINETLFGERYDYNDCKPLMEYVEAFNKFITVISSSFVRFIAVKFFWVRYVPILGYYIVDRHIDAKKKLMEYISASVSASLKTFKADEEPTCFVHSYKQKIGSSPHLTEKQLHATCDDLFLAGTESTTTTIRWGLLLLAKYQDIQDRMREEIHSVCGTSTIPSMADKLNLPYTIAVVHEIQRWANILSMNVLRKTQRDTNIMGCNIPNGTLVNGDLYTVHAHDDIFTDPEVFRPERYLHADRKSINKEAVDRTIPFSLGRRKCAGEGLARVELLLGLAATIQKYRILPTTTAPIDLTPLNRIVIMPPHQPVQLEKL